MKKLPILLFAVVMMLSITFVGDAISSSGSSAANAQTVVVKKTRHGVVSRSYRGGKRVTRRVYSGGKYVVVKTVKGTRYVSHKTPAATPRPSIFTTPRPFPPHRGILQDNKPSSTVAGIAAIERHARHRAAPMIPFASPRKPASRCPFVPGRKRADRRLVCSMKAGFPPPALPRELPAGGVPSG